MAKDIKRDGFSVELLNDMENSNRKEKQEKIGSLLDQWDEEAKNFLEQNIADPAILKAALDNKKYKEEVVELSGKSLSELIDENKNLNQNDTISEISSIHKTMMNDGAKHEDVSSSAKRGEKRFIWVLLGILMVIAVLGGIAKIFV